jgi:hypothetical protein
MHQAKSFRQLFASLLFVITAIGGSLVVQAQKKAGNEPAPKKVAVRESGRDPFRKYEAPRPISKKSLVVTPPSIQERIAQYRAQKLAAMNAHLEAPKPTTALLLGEIQVIGISRTPRGYAAIVEATPIKLSYVIYPGERFYDGQLVAVEDTRLVFRHETVFTDGRRERSVEMKALRQPDPVEAMTAVKAAPANSADSEKKPDEKKPDEKVSAPNPK